MRILIAICIAVGLVQVSPAISQDLHLTQHENVFNENVFISVSPGSVEDDPFDSPYSYNNLNKARRVTLEYMVTGTTSLGDKIYIEHCEGAPFGCRDRVDVLVERFFKSSKEYRIDPWTLLALSIHRTQFNPFFSSTDNTSGIMALKSQDHQMIRFLWDENVRAACQDQPDACQVEIIRSGAEMFRRSLDFCNHNIRASLHHYEHGVCRNNSATVRKVLNIKKQMLDKARLITEVVWCEPYRPICDMETLPETEDVLDGMEYYLY